MAHELELTTSRRGLAAVLRVGGTFDLHGADRFDAEINRILHGPTREILVDLREVEFMDSIGLRCLVAAHRRAFAEKVPLWIVRGGPPVAQVLRMTGLDMVLPLIDDLPRRLRPGRQQPRLPLAVAQRDMRISSGNR
jgi:anti-anti-sigma factor